jgi:hypothetical protein
MFISNCQMKESQSGGVAAALQKLARGIIRI